MKKLLLVLVLIVATISALVALDRRGQIEQPGEVTRKTVAPEVVARRAGMSTGTDKQILFGDLHVHTTYSVDAHAWSMPIFHGEGVHPPAEACDYARFCSDLDFWATTEHAESLTPRHWRELKDTVRQCNAVAGDPANPDLVSFLGWEWTQMGNTPAEHYGHKNVIFIDTDDDKVPARPISAGGMAARAMRHSSLPFWRNLISPYLDWDSRQSQINQQLKMKDLKAQPLCPDGLPERDMPVDCVEFAETPKELFAKLNDWGFDALVIPHGNTWGYYTPPGSSWDKQLTRAQHDPARQTLIEVFSGHGNSEEFRDWREIAYDSDGRAVCPPPTKDYLPSCWRAGELIRERCGTLSSDECEQRVAKAQADYLAAGRAGHITTPGVQLDEWLDSGQCRDCYLPAFNYRPRSSVQYAMALSNFEEKNENGDGPLRFRFGFIASSDNHSAQPGTGYKEIGRHDNADVFGQDGIFRESFINAAKAKGRGVDSVPYDLTSGRFNFMQIAESERQQSYFYTGGLVAVHSAGRNREAIWDGLKRREVYGTSGERMLLWFDLLGAGGATAPMGSEVQGSGVPRFRARAVGDFEQLPGCPEHSTGALAPEQIKRICRGECYNPSDTRKAIDRIEVVRIRPKQTPGEDVAPLIQDPWRTFACSGDQGGCTVEFDDPEFPGEQREVIYYVRAIEKPTTTVNAGNLRCEYNERGECIAVKPCYGDTRTADNEDCSAPAAERAWSSPIFVQPPL